MVVVAEAVAMAAVHSVIKLHDIDAFIFVDKNPFPRGRERVSKLARNERSGARERSEQCGASEVSSAGRANERADERMAQRSMH